MLFRGGTFRSDLYRGPISSVPVTVVYAVPYGDILVATPQGEVLSTTPQAHLTNLPTTPQANIL